MAFVVERSIRGQGMGDTGNTCRVCPLRGELGQVIKNHASLLETFSSGKKKKLTGENIKYKNCGRHPGISAWDVPHCCFFIKCDVHILRP